MRVGPCSSLHYPSQESVPLAHIFCLTGHEWSPIWWAKIRQNTERICSFPPELVYNQARLSVPPPPNQDSINEWIILLLKSWICWYSCSCGIQIQICIPACSEQWIHTRDSYDFSFLPAQFSWIWCKCLQSNFIHSQIFQSDWIQRGYRKKIHGSLGLQECRFDLKLVAAITNRFVHRILQGKHDLAWL